MHPRFQAAFARLAENLQSALAPILADEHFPALLTAEQITTLKQATDLDEDAGFRIAAAGCRLCTCRSFPL